MEEKKWRNTLGRNTFSSPSSEVTSTTDCNGASQHSFKSHTGGYPARRDWCLPHRLAFQCITKGPSECFCHSTNVSCLLAGKCISFVQNLPPCSNYRWKPLQPIPFSCLRNSTTEMKDGSWCLLEAEGICKRFQFSPSISHSIETEEKETALSMGPRVLTFTVQGLKKKNSKKI